MYTTRAIVFGATGNVGSIVASTAQKHGTKVFLGMRDIDKPIPGFDSIMERHDGFERVQADLTQPKSIFSAVKATEATSAFVYLAHGMSDHMKASIEALKAAGITFVVFLSSFTIKGDLDTVKPEDRIPFIHAQVEMNLATVFGSKNYVALRPGAFATNTLRWKAGIDSGFMQLDNPDTKYDFITPIDMGRVGGTILAQGQRENQHIVYLYGPQLMAQKEAISIVAKTLGKTLEAIPMKEQDSSEGDRSSIAGDRLLVSIGPEQKKSDWFTTAYSNFGEGVSNVFEYTGIPAMSYQAWVVENKSRFV